MEEKILVIKNKSSNVKEAMIKFGIPDKGKYYDGIHEKLLDIKTRYYTIDKSEELKKKLLEL